MCPRPSGPAPAASPQQHLGASTPAHAPAATVTADARTLDLLPWGRVGPDTAGVVIDGDRGALDAALDAPLTP